MNEIPPTLVLLCHQADWEHRYQASAAAAAAASSGQEVRMVLFFSALESWLAGEWDALSSTERGYRGQTLAERVEETGVASPSELMAAARRAERCRVLACSASLALIGADPVVAREQVDEIVGWPTILRLMRSPASILYL